MALQYLAVHSDAKGAIVAIAERWLDARGVLKIHTAWDHKKGERGIVEDFVAGSHFWSNKWTFVACGVRVQPQLGALWNAAMKYGMLEFGADAWKEKSTVDLHPVLVLLNFDHRRPDNSYGDMPDQFYGADLQKFARRNIDSASIGPLVAAKQFDAAMAIIKAEAEAFFDLWQILSTAMPVLRESVIRPAFAPPSEYRLDELT